MPEHVVFALGFSFLAIFLSIVILLARRSLHIIAQSCGVVPAPVAHNGTAVLGFLAIPFLCLMAWIPDSASPMHFYSALIMFGMLALYQLALAVLATAVLRRTPGWPLPLLLLTLYFLLCALGALGAACGWVSAGSDGMYLEYIAVALEFCFFLGASVLFDMAVRAQAEAGLSGDYLLERRKRGP